MQPGQWGGVVASLIWDPNPQGSLRAATRLPRLLAALILSLTVVVGFTESLDRAARARSWSDIESSQRLRIAVKTDLPPLSFVNPDGERIGFEIDLARELTSRLLGSDAELELIPVRNLERLEVVTTEHVDLAIAQIGITVDRARQVRFSSPYYQDGTAILVAQSSGIESWSDLQQQSIAILEGSAAIPVVKSMFPDLNLVGVLSYQAGIEQVEAETVAGFAADGSVLAGWVLDHPEYWILEPRLSSVGLAVAMPKGIEANELGRRVHEVVEDLKQSGWLAERARHWGLPER